MRTQAEHLLQIPAKIAYLMLSFLTAQKKLTGKCWAKDIARVTDMSIKPDYRASMSRAAMRPKEDSMWNYRNGNVSSKLGAYS